MLNILLCGVGGQGTVLASKILAKSAIRQGKTAHTAETIGMAQRGGSVTSHVRIGEHAHSPLIPLGQADILIAFEPAEAVRNLPYLKEGGTAIVSNTAVKPVTDALSSTDYSGDVMFDYLRNENIRLIEVDGKNLIHTCGSAKVLNMALLGAAAASGEMNITTDELAEIIRSTMPEKFRAMNLKAVELGACSVR